MLNCFYYVYLRSFVIVDKLLKLSDDFDGLKFATPSEPSDTSSPDFFLGSCKVISLEFELGTRVF